MNNNTVRLVTSLGLSQRLEKAGYPQGDSIFLWQVFDYPENRGLNIVKLVARKDVVIWEEQYGSDHGVKWELKYYAAPLCGEIMELLPNRIDVEISKCFIMGSSVSRWACYVTYIKNEDIKMPREFYDTPAEACGEMYAYLKENGLIK